jgi:hypothetical protein
LPVGLFVWAGIYAKGTHDDDAPDGLDARMAVTVTSTRRGVAMTTRDRKQYDAVVSPGARLEFPEAFLDELCRILCSDKIEIWPNPGQTTPFLDGEWTLVAGRWQQQGSRAIIELDVTNDFGDALCVEVRAENCQRELSRQPTTDQSETPYDELLGDITSLLQALLIPKRRVDVDRLVLPPY